MRLTIYSKPGCHLCDVMKEVVGRVLRDRELDVDIEEIDITADDELLSRYATEIPVLMIDGRQVAKYRVAEDELRRMLARRE